MCEFMCLRDNATVHVHVDDNAIVADCADI
jgi:hypothetical protein